MDTRTQGRAVLADFVGRPREFFGLVVGGSLLQIPTFGFYRFWLLTDIRRHLWSNTRVGVDTFEYTGRGMELLIGFLIALAILAPVYLIYFLISWEAERIQAFASVPLLLFMYVLGQYGSFRARRYRMTRTIFRGLRFWMTGSGWAYAGRALLWDILTVLTLGLAYPWRAAALERYRMKHTHYGDLPGAFVETGWTLFKRGWWLWLAGVLVIIGAVLFSGLVVGNRLNFQRAMVGSAIPIFAVIILALVVWPLFRAIQLRWRFDGVRFGEVSVKSVLTKSTILWCYVQAWVFVFVFSLLLSLVLAGVIIASGVNLSSVNAQSVASSPIFIIGNILLYLLVVLSMGIIKLQFIDRGVWAEAVDSLTVFNITALDAAVARGAAADSVGEGLADALDFGGVGV